MKLDHPAVNRLITVALFLLAFYFRASGLFHGLDERSVFHPDTPKQIQNLDEGLRNNHLNYYGNWFYDGYPYGLNRMDEAVIRVTRAVVLAPLYRLTHGQDHSLPPPSRWRLFYYTRILRLFYGMVIAVLLMTILKRLTGSRLISICALALYAVSPLSISVTHYASGDIGIDLFLAFALFFLTLHTRKPAQRYLFAAGVSVGFAFASKYQGALGAWIVAVYVLQHAFPLKKKTFLIFLQRGAVSATGFFAGAFLFTPGFWYDPSTTWRLMRINFRNIKNYTAPNRFSSCPATPESPPVSQTTFPRLWPPSADS
ncbi:MAG: glycosyltransferase family 39 protein [Verrucomicrobia bacterium]|nr:glycosyltransferase family 39 protein [Verrucomicrobiota bacterium]MCH8528942.1 glycosyltransferase family 39 protein [Kiritimatiellia bacterium]